jgi:2-hydroxy-6-oxonona-2,4-dienedioate hydrolase
VSDTAVASPQRREAHPMGRPRYVDVDGVRTRYFDLGEGHPVVLVHGGDFRSLSSADDWSRNAAALAREFRVIAVDKLGQGFTGLPVSDAEFTMSATGRHLAAFLDVLGLGEVTLAGHSRGALPVAWLAVEQPQRVRALVVFSSNTLAPEHPDTPRDFYHQAYADRPQQPDLEYVCREPVRNSYDASHVDDAFAARRLEIARLEKTAAAVSAMARLYENRFRPDFLALRARVLERIDAGGLTCPVSVLWGRNDVSAPLVLGEMLTARLAASTSVVDLHVFNHAGHYVYREQPDACNGTVEEFVARFAGR